VNENEQLLAVDTY